MSKKFASKTANTSVAITAVETIEAVVEAPVTMETVVEAPVVKGPVVVGIAEKTFSVAGVSNLNGVYKARFANHINRIKVLHKNAHTDIRLIELPYAMTKRDAVQYLMDLPNCTEASDELKQKFTDLNAVQAFDDLLNGTVPRRVHPVATVSSITTAIANAMVTLTTGFSSEAIEPQELASFDDADFAEVEVA
jgi:acyl-coenzyme A thioesterase PaaI-like protein